MLEERREDTWRPCSNEAECYLQKPEKDSRRNQKGGVATPSHSGPKAPNDGLTRRGPTPLALSAPPATSLSRVICCARAIWGGDGACVA